MKHFEKNWLEWAVFGLGSAIVLAVLGYLAYEAATSTDRAAVVDVRLGEPQQKEGQFTIPVTVINRGDQAVENVLVEVQLQRRSGGVGKEPTAELQVKLLPGGATHKGWVTFSGEPQGTDSFKARAVSFVQP